MPEIVNIEPKHLTGKDGIGKGSKRRRGENTALYHSEYERIFGPRKEADVADDSNTGGRLPTDGRRNRCGDAGGKGR